MNNNIRILILILLLSAQTHAESKIRNCQVDGQKFGTNLLCDDKNYNIPSETKEEEALFAKCETGKYCEIDFEADSNNVVIKIISAKPGVFKTSKTFTTSFNCQKANGFVENTICLHEELAQLDVELNLAYKQALEAAQDKTVLKTEQKKWVKEKRNLCQELECLNREYKSQILALNQSVKNRK